MILAIISIAAQVITWLFDYKETKAGIALGVAKEKNWLFRNDDGTLNVTKAIIIGFGIEYGVAIGAYFFTNAFKNAEQSVDAGWYAFGCVLIGFAVWHLVAALKWDKAIKYAKDQRGL